MLISCLLNNAADEGELIQTLSWKLLVDLLCLVPSIFRAAHDSYFNQWKASSISKRSNSYAYYCSISISALLIVDGYFYVNTRNMMYIAGSYFF